jgi:hypothetical protein
MNRYEKVISTSSKKNTKQIVVITEYPDRKNRKGEPYKTSQTLHVKG